MSFKDAFGRARAELGPDGTFIWRGNEYNTRLAEDNQPAPGTQGDLRPGDPGYGVYKVPDKSVDWDKYISKDRPMNPNFPIPGTVNAPYEINPPYDWMRGGAYPGGSRDFDESGGRFVVTPAVEGQWGANPPYGFRTGEVVRASDGAYVHPNDLEGYEASLRRGSSSGSSSGSWRGAMDYGGMK